MVIVAITQKMIKDEIKNSEKMISDTIQESQKTLEDIKKKKDESGNINPKKDKELIEVIDDYNGLRQTLQYYTGHLNALEWVLSEMRAKNRKRSKKSEGNKND